MVDYACMRLLYGVEITDTWEHRRQAKDYPEDVWELMYAGISHSDLMDEITELRQVYRANWLAEYTSYRLGKALLRWDAEYDYWRGLEARLEAFSREYKSGQPLPPLDSITKAH
jgi:hypothetical protein